jgi:hypothetical protein
MTSDTDRIRFHIACETEGEVSPIQREPQLPPDQLEVVERLAAADMVIRMRRVKHISQSWPETTRVQYEKAFEALSLQFAAAAAYLKRHRVDDEIPEFLKVRNK